MRRETSAERAAVTRRRLDSLGRELREAGVLRNDPDPLPDAILLPDPGRHAGVRPLPFRERARERIGDGLGGRVRVALGARHLVPLLAGLVLALGVAAWVALRSTPEVVPAPPVRTEAASPTAGPTGAAVPAGSTSGSTSGSTAGATAGVVVVDVAGKVRRPGIVRLPGGSRVVDALREAGGARPGVDLSGLNLARVLVDGEQVLVGSRATGAGAPASGAGPAGALVSLNTAGADELDSLPGVGPVTARKILDWRAEHGPFTSVEELLDVDGIGAKTLADLAPRVTL